MGLIGEVLAAIFGSGRNVVRDTAEVFIPNAEAQAQRDHSAREAALGQFGAEFRAPERGRFDRLMDALNRLPRPAMALGTLGLFVSAMIDPVWFGARMAGLALVPEPLWWLLGAIVSFYFGARHLEKGRDFRRDLMRSAVPPVIERHAPQNASTGPVNADGNAALDDWLKHRH
ncbi:holin family protein [Marivita sp. GX14005]|uniref:holin family protein n=1 Tax=Marivita sp. GX14005 TaxID=2942276 RepID=UPI002019C590|nr:holin family protein [Marivita sp. GX14005]MCL3883441.1 holin family protein [Marivita sp. GX14005]